jgi:hypothetical protein
MGRCATAKWHPGIWFASLCTASAAGCWPAGYHIGTADTGSDSNAAAVMDSSVQSAPATSGMSAKPAAIGVTQNTAPPSGPAQPATQDDASVGTRAPHDDPPTGTAHDDAAHDDDAGLAQDPPATLQPGIMGEQAGWSALQDWAGLPTFAESTSLLFSTHEREGKTFSLIDPGNKDFNSFLAVCGDRPTLLDQQNDASVVCAPGQSGYLVSADDGPGYVSRILLARGVSDPSSSILTNVRPTAERIRIYIDGQSTPIVDGFWSDWANAQSPPFDAPLSGWTSGGTISYLPLSYSSQLRVVVDELASSPVLYYVQVNTHRVQNTQPSRIESLASADARTELNAMLARAREAGTTWFDDEVTLDGSGARTIWTRDNAGTLQRIELTLDATSAQAIMTETTLRLSWDDGAPAIDLPLALLFGTGHVLAPFSTLPLTVTVEPSAVRLSFSLPMPFAKSARLELVHDTTTARTVKLRLGGSDALPRADWGRLHAALSKHSAPQPGERFRVASLSGRGKYVGTLLYARGQTDASRSVPADELGFLEGDERLEIDDRVAGLGTGTDNYFNGGFYFRDGLFNSLFAAVSQLTTQRSDGTSEATLLRWNILGDALNFQRQLDLSFEFGADRPATVRDYAAVSYYYQ